MGRLRDGFCLELLLPIWDGYLRRSPLLRLWDEDLGKQSDDLLFAIPLFDSSFTSSTDTQM